jgi:hypothetical protein
MPVLPLKADIRQRECRSLKADLYCEASSPKGCLILTALRQRLALASEVHP